VIIDLAKLLKRHLEDGNIVRFDDFGSFSVSIKSEGVDEEDKFHASMITKSKINARPGSDLREMLFYRFSSYF
jgi:predicted histone-like DNA-binding protein